MSCLTVERAGTAYGENRPWFQASFLLYAAVFLAGILVYAQILKFDLTYFDDQLWVGDMGWRVRGWGELFSQRDILSYAYYRPLLNLSFLANALVVPHALWPYYLVNALLHAVNGCLVLAIAVRLGYSWRMAFPLSLVFVVHPTLAQAVAWIPGRTESLVSVFVLGAFLCFLDCLKDHRPGSYLGHQVFLLVALLCKEVAVVLPALCWLYAWLVARRKIFQSENLFFILGWAVIFAVWLGMRLHALHGEPGLGTAYVLRKFLANFPAVLTYLGKAVLPVGLAVLPGPERWWDLPRVASLVCLGGLVVLVTGRGRRLVWFGMAWFMLFLLPGLVVADFFFEYRLYLPLLGMLIILGAALPPRFGERHQAWGWVIAAAIIGVLFVTCQKQAASFRDRLSFWEAAARGNPGSAFAHTSLGAIYHMQGDIGQALSHYSQAVESNPREPIVHNNLGLIQAGRGDYPAALREYAQEIANNPTYPTVYYNLAELYVVMKDYARAEKVWFKALELAPRNPRPVQGLIRLYLMTGQNQKAEALAAGLRK